MHFETFDMERGEGTRFPSIGRCIYCGDDRDKLTDEHVIPFALSGNTVIFEAACCIPCQRIIQPYEQRILRKQLGVFRARIGAPTRNKKDRLATSRLHFIEVDESGVPVRDLGYRDLPIDEAPFAFSVWDLAPPRVLGEATTEAEHVGRPWTYVQRDVAEKLARMVASETGSKHAAIRVDQINREDFLRFLAKLAHSFAISKKGSGAFKPTLVDQILLRSDDLTTFVGGDPGLVVHESDPANMTELLLGEVTDGPAKGCTAVRVRLYPLLGTPAHIVVVGTPN